MSRTTNSPASCSTSSKRVWTPTIDKLAERKQFGAVFFQTTSHQFFFGSVRCPFHYKHSQFLPYRLDSSTLRRLHMCKCGWSTEATPTMSCTTVVVFYSFQYSICWFQKWFVHEQRISANYYVIIILRKISSKTSNQVYLEGCMRDQLLNLVALSFWCKRPFWKLVKETSAL